MRLILTIRLASSRATAAYLCLGWPRKKTEPDFFIDVQARKYPNYKKEWSVRVSKRWKTTCRRYSLPRASRVALKGKQRAICSSLKNPYLASECWQIDPLGLRITLNHLDQKAHVYRRKCAKLTSNGGEIANYRIDYLAAPFHAGCPWRGAVLCYTT